MGHTIVCATSARSLLLGPRGLMVLGQYYAEHCLYLLPRISLNMEKSSLILVGGTCGTTMDEGNMMEIMAVAMRTRRPKIDTCTLLTELGHIRIKNDI